MEVEYTFKHALTQEVAYSSMLIERRKLIHTRTGAAIETAFAGYLEDHIERLAYHYSHSGDARKTARYMSLAAEQALRRADYSDAMRRVEAGLEALKTLPEGIERDEFELAFQIVRAEAIDKRSGRAADPAVLEAYSRAHSLCARVGTTTQTVLVLWGLQRFYQVKGETRIARGFAEEMVTVAERTDNPQLIMAVRSRLGHNLSMLGEFDKARPLLEEAAVHLDPASNWFGDDKVFALIMLARVLWFLGFPAEAARRNEESLVLSRAIAFWPPNLAMPASITILFGDWARTMQISDELHALAVEHEAPYYRDHAQRLRGAALIQSGQLEQGLALIDPYIGLAGLKGSRGLEYWHFLVPAAHAYGRGGRVRFALQLIDDALSDSAANGQSMLEAEYRRVKGELLLMGSTPDAAAAEESLHQAIDIARGQIAKIPQLRATTSLARLLSDTNRRDEARAMLADVYNWFTEGFDTADLKDAKALLDSLNA